MSACFGILHLDGAPASQEALAQMDAALAYWGADGGGLYREGPVALGSRLRKITLEDQSEQQPWCAQGVVYVAHVRLDNRAELCRALGLADQPTLPDGRLILAAYQRFGADCVQHLRGDWAFALWDQAQRRLLLARDASGNTGLYWWQQGDTLVFATAMKGVLAHPAVRSAPDLRFLANLLAVFDDPEYETATAYLNIQSLLPGHALIADPHGVRVQRWWRPERLAPLMLPCVEDYYEAFRALYQDAVTQRLRVHGGAVAATLSGGLDSGSVVALAAPLLAQRGERLKAYVHTPLYAPSGAGSGRTGDEWPLAQQTAAHVGAIDLTPMRSEQISVTAGMSWALWAHDAPSHAAGNQYWIQDILQTARAEGAKVVLTGQGGNATVSYAGQGSLLPLLWAGRFAQVAAALRAETGGVWRAGKRRLLKPAVQPLLARWRRWRQPPTEAALARYTALSPLLIQQLALLLRMRRAGFDPYFAVVPQRALDRFRLGQGSRTLALWMENGAAVGLDVRDPTRDQRLVEFCWRLPDAAFWGAGQQRALVRVALARHLPPAVLHCAHKGLQSADLGGRVQHGAAEVRAILGRLAADPLAQQCLDLPRMQMAFTDLLAAPAPSPALGRRVQSILLRGLGVGMFGLQCLRP